MGGQYGQRTSLWDSAPIRTRARGTWPASRPRPVRRPVVSGNGDVRYSLEYGQTVVTYVCKENATRQEERSAGRCLAKWSIPAISTLLVELMTPMTLEVTLAVQSELMERAAETDALRRKRHRANPLRR